MIQKIKTILKKTPLYSLYRNYKLVKKYAEKYGLTYGEAKSNTTVVRSELKKVLKNVNISNCGVGEFYYCLDTSLIINNRHTMIGNMPVDYGFLLTNNFENANGINVIKEYIKRINDHRVTLNTPTTLKEALQCILFWNSLLWQTGHSLVGLGRLDKVLDIYPVPDDAEQLLCDFLKTLHCAYHFKSASLIGDTGQIILLGGLESDGSYFSNEYTYLFIKCLKKIHLPDPKILLRCSANMPKQIMELAVDCASTGIGSPLFSNDDVIIPKLIDFGYEEKDAFNYGVSACWEPLSIGNSLEQNNITNVEYGRCANQTILDECFVNCKSIDEVIDIYLRHLKDNCNEIKTKLNMITWEKDPLLSLMMGLDKDISEGGCKYNNYGLLSVGISAAVNTILNIKKYVFLDKKYSLDDIQKFVQNNDVLKFSDNNNGFGTDSEDAIIITNLLIRETENFFRDYRNKFGGKVKFGLSSPTYIGSGSIVGATLDGRRDGEPFETHISRDKGDPITEIMNFESKLHFSGISSNANVLDVMIQSSLIKENVKKFAQYIMGGIKEGIFQIQINVLSYAQLVDAKKHPEKYPNLIVRVWGFSSYFNDLPEEYKDNLIRRAKNMEMIV